jgi:serine/threonine-protein kinase
VAFLGMAAFQVLRGAEPVLAPGREGHLLATAIALALWLVARRPEVLSPASLKLLDALGTLGLTLCLVVMGYRYSQLHQFGHFAGTISVFHVVMARAILVPSSPWRTLVVTGLSFAFLVVSQALLLRPDQMGFVIGPITSGATGTALAAVASKVIYGLHRDVRRARQLGQYTLEEKIGEGGMGEVYRARHAMLRRPTAIKLLASQVTERDLRRFEKEVQLTAQLTHPNTISIFDYGRTPDGIFYYAMELLDGVTLQELVDRDGPQSPARVIHILLQACGALREAHGAGLTHRDVKPDNIFLCRHGGLPDVVKVLDFGLVKQVANDAAVSQSNVNLMVGTPLYMSPESIAAPDTVDARSDLYALGAVAYFLLCGKPVFSGESVVEVCGHHLHSKPEPLSRRGGLAIASDLERIVLSCLEKTQRDRPQSAEELARLLRSCADANGWTEEDAESWWQCETNQRSCGSAECHPRTMQVALEDRLDVTDAA